MKNKCCRVVLTGGAGGGKTTAADLYRVDIHVKSENCGGTSGQRENETERYRLAQSDILVGAVAHQDSI